MDCLLNQRDVVPISAIPHIIQRNRPQSEQLTQQQAPLHLYENPVIQQSTTHPQTQQSAAHQQQESSQPQAPLHLYEEKTWLLPQMATISEAENLLSAAATDCFLVFRENDSIFVLSKYSQKTSSFRHFSLEKTPSKKLKMTGLQREFINLQVLINELTDLKEDQPFSLVGYVPIGNVFSLE